MVLSRENASTVDRKATDPSSARSNTIPTPIEVMDKVKLEAPYMDEDIKKSGEARLAAEDDDSEPDQKEKMFVIGLFKRT